MKLALLNSLVITNAGCYKAKEISTMEAKCLIRSYARTNGLESYIGHTSTASFLSQLIGIPVEVNRQRFKQRTHQPVICFKLYDRLPENKCLHVQDLKTSAYAFFLLQKIE
ncbi:DUF1874 domain-containing protein [Listeria booriae]|uniref:DUF1874 domain-containing protein n=1 Tax=Listeria booriae TaxID=1552123 RepID=A0A099WDU6_9LIST|nr:DUF1874 domain-containing protein [Listeria booriae]KGL42693.1 hypothetical protein EP57_04330 [Listeria booriae]MBC1358284.1 DUF1874 domain-containing protein [Listeria booriae]MBC1502427.1 DUF1874 domain-containing protein [Listeria booriae]MBC1559430.1 DUF1874 domain-containing protein [Listeria booriae]MBC1566951.1 DUF1874 domain-containing protein [Listeria booriae]